MKLFSRLLIAGSLFATSMATVYADTKTYPSSMCQPASHASAESMRYYSGELRNEGDGYMLVQCPIVRDNASTLNGTRSARILVRSNGRQMLRCSLASKTQAGESISPSSRSVRNSSTSANTVTSLNVDVSLSSRNGIYSIYCRIPPSSSIFSYVIDEFNF